MGLGFRVQGSDEASNRDLTREVLGSYLGDLGGSFKGIYEGSKRVLGFRVYLEDQGT